MRQLWISRPAAVFQVKPMMTSPRSLPGWMLVTGLILQAGSLRTAQANDDLFSKVSIDAPFAQVRDADDAPTPQAPRGLRVTGASALTTLLQEANFETKSISTRVVATEIKRDKWNIPVRVSVFYDDDQMELALLLKALGNDYSEADVSSEKLLELMAASRNFAPAFFTYDAEYKRIELRQRISNRGVTTANLKRSLERLADIAIDNEAAWNLPKPTATKPPATKPASTPPPAPSAISVSALLGTWAADRSKDEAIALKLDADGKFILAIAKGSNTTRSNGKFSLSGQTLSLTADDGTKLNGTVRLNGTNGFDLQLPGNSKIRFTKAN